jgi:hypothetical protein
MILLVSIGVAIVLLVILLYALPLRVGVKGKSMILATSVFIGIIGIMSMKVLSLWQVILYPLLLSVLFSYFLMKKLELKQETRGETAVENISPVFSFEQQVEKAKLAETIDDYYDSVGVPDREKIDKVSIEVQSDEPQNIEQSKDETIDIETPNIEMETKSIEPSTVELISIEALNSEQQSPELQEVTPFDMETDQQPDNITDEIVGASLAEVSPSLETIIPDIEEIDFEARDRYTIEESFAENVEQSIASSLETEEEMLMERRIRVFQDMDENDRERDVVQPTEEIHEATIIGEATEEKDFARIEQLEEIRDFTRMEELEEITNGSVLESFEENSDSTSEEEMKAESVMEALAGPRREQTVERREKQKMYEDRVEAQFEDLEEIYLRKKGVIRNKEE